MGMKTTKLADLLTLHVIALTIGGQPAYLAPERNGRPTTWDGAWFTRDIGEAKTYKTERNAEKRIAEQGSAWAELAPRVVIKSLARV